MSEAPRIRVSHREGYDLWAESYDQTPNPLVALDARHTIEHLAPKAGETILDAGCGTGRNLQALMNVGSKTTGVDFSQGMIDVAKQKYPDVAFFVSPLDTLPEDLVGFDAVLCALVGEHLTDLKSVVYFFPRGTQTRRPACIFGISPVVGGIGSRGELHAGQQRVPPGC
jgi:ubiquinone/menaquinone biosynthesis C-methylase UbiE